MLARDESLEEARRSLIEGPQELARRAARLVRWRAILLWLTASIACAAMLVVADAALQREETGLRIIAIVTLVCASSYAAFRMLVPAWRFSPTPAQIARWVERRRPQSEQQLLSTAVELANISGEDRRFGSAHFRNSAIQHWHEQGFRPQWQSFLDSGSWWRAVLGLAALMLLVAGCFIVWPAHSWTGLERLFAPWSNRPWPRDDNLELLDPPSAVAVGSPIQIEIIDHDPPMPDQVHLEVRMPGGETGVNTPADDSADSPNITNSITMIPATLVGDIAVVNVPPVERSIEVRAVGGDDQSMPWHRIEVVRPPRIERYHFSVKAPAYTGGADKQIVGKRIVALYGSRIRYVGRLSSPVQKLGLRIGKSESTSELQDWSIKLEQNMRDFVIESPTGEAWVANESLDWQFEITTDDSLDIVLPNRWSVEVIRDNPPEVLLREPDMLDVSLAATLPLVGRAEDDLGLVNVVARCELGGADVTRQEIAQRDKPTASNVGLTRSDKSPTVDRLLWTRAGDGQNVASQPVKELTVDTTWKAVTQLVGSEQAEPEAVELDFSVWLEATDTLGQIGRSQSITFRIRNQKDLLLALAQKQESIIERLRELTESQRRNMRLSARVAENISRSEKVGFESTETLSSIAQIQSTISRELSGNDPSPNETAGNGIPGSQAGIRSQIQALNELYESNELNAAQNLRELNSLQREIDQIARTSMPAAVEATRSAADAFRHDDIPSDVTAGQRSALDESQMAQTEVVEQLQTLLDQLSRAEATIEIQRELFGILGEQRQIQAETESLNLKEAGSEELDQADSERNALTADQRALARKLDRLAARIREVAENAGEELSPALAGASKAASIVVDNGTTGKMRQTADQIEDKEFIEAARTQDEIIDILQEAVEQTGLQDPTDSPLSQRADELLEASQALSQLAERQTSLAQQIESADRSTAEALVNDQSQLRAETTSQSEQLDFDGRSTSAAESIQNAVNAQSSAINELSQAQLESAADQAEKASEELRKAASELLERSEQLESAARQEQVFQLEQAVDLLVREQQEVVGVLVELRKQASEDRDPNQMRRAASKQTTTRQMLVELRQKTDELPAFDWMLEQTELDMLQSVAATERFLIDPNAIEAASAALRKLQIAQTVFQSHNSLDLPEQSDASGQEGTDDSNSAERIVPPIISLKLMRGLQIDLNEQTATWNKRPESDPRRYQAIEGLSKQQKTLGQRLEQLMLEFGPPDMSSKDDQAQ